MKETTDRDLIFFLSEAEMLAGYINDAAEAKDHKKIAQAVQDFRQSVKAFDDVLERYSKSTVVNPKILLKGRDFSAYAQQVLEKCHQYLRQNFQILPDQPSRLN